MKEILHYRDTLLRRYREQPGQLKLFAGGRTPSLHISPAEGEWTPHQILCHIVAAEEHALFPRLIALLEEEEPFLENWDEQAWMEREYDPTAEVMRELHRLEQIREKGAARLEGLSPEHWNRTGFHPYQGVRTLAFWVEYSVAHVEDHLRQLSRDGIDGV